MRCLAALLVVGLTCLSGPAVSDEIPVFHIVQPTDEAHELLPKTCRVCHTDKSFRFFVVAAPEQTGLDRALAMLLGQAGSAVASRQKPPNPHASIACLFCHLDPVSEGEKRLEMSFRTLDEAPASRSDVERLCQLCHPDADKGHPRAILGKRAAAPDLERAGLLMAGEEIQCSTCHEMHGEDVGSADVKLAYLDFAAKSRSSFPHGNRVACRACHPDELPQGSDPVFLDPDATARCVRCHEADHGGIHPMGVSPSEKTYPMDFLDYPLDDEGHMSCSTCHDHVCTGRLDPRNESFLRGGPYLATTEFCYRCHPRAGIGTLNPHEQVDEKGNLVSTTCAFCHRTIPDPENPEEAYFGPEDLLYLHSPVELCMGCHDPGPHPTGVNHLVEMPEEHATKLTRYEERHKVRMPLDEGRRVVCTTCHNPHAKGVLRGQAALGAEESHRWRIPSYAELCTPCHARYD